MKIKRLLFPILFQTIIYVVQFIVVPNVYHISSYDIARASMVIVSSVIIITVWGMIQFSDKFVGWFLGLGVYSFLVMAYHPDNLYGIGNGMFDFDIISVGVIVTITFILQFAIWSVLKICNRFRMKSK